MKSPDFYLKIADIIVNEVSRFLIKNFGSKKKMVHKDGNHYGIKDDVSANQLYENYLRDKTPEISLYTEEGARNLKSEYVWVVDPIEGTSNYRAGVPFFATQIALLRRSEPILAIVNAPILKQKFVAVKDKGAFLNNRRIHFSGLKNLKLALVEIGRGTRSEDKRWYVETLTKLNDNIRTNRSFGANGLALCYCAAGMVDAYINSGSEIYDYIPGSLIFSESGAIPLNLDGKRWTLKDSNMIAANSKLSGDILKII